MSTGSSVSHRRSTVRRAALRASAWKPELKAGWPQQVWDSGTSISTPSLSSTDATESPASGYISPRMQVWNRRTFTGGPGRGEVMALSPRRWIRDR